jgi:flagellar secretion chaperone FliS
MPIDVNNPYIRTKILTASPEELRMMLIDGFIRFMNDGRAALVAKNFEKVYENFSSARAILVELMNGLRPEVAPELCEKLQSLYGYMFKLLVEGSFEKDLAKLDEVTRLMEFERETWQMLLDKLAKERAGQPAAAHAAAPAPSAPSAGTYQPLSLSA